MLQKKLFKNLFQKDRAGGGGSGGSGSGGTRITTQVS